MTSHPGGFMESFADLRPDLALIRGTTARNSKHLADSGSMFSVELGRCTLKVGMAAWRIEDEKTVFLGSEDPRELIAERIVMLDGRTVVDVTPEAPGGEVIFDFSGARLHLFPTHSGHFYEFEGAAVPDEREHWNLFLPDGDMIVAGPGAWLGRKSSSRLEVIFDYWTPKE